MVNHRIRDSEDDGEGQMKYFIQAFKKDGKFTYRVWAEHEYGPEMNELEIMDWAKELVSDVEGVMGKRLERARDKGASGVFDVGV